MSSTSSNGRSEWDLAISPVILQFLREFSEVMGTTAAGLFRTAYRRLRESPEEFGEPLYHLKKSPGVVRHAAVAPLAIVFAVYPEERKVWLTPAWLLTLPDSAS